MKIAMGADHGGYSLKEVIKQHLVEAGHEVLDLGTHDTSSCNYPVYAEKVAYAVADKDADLGVLICGTGFGISLSANRISGIRCVNATDGLTVRLSRQHNNSNMISIGARVVGTEKAISLMDTFLTEDFDGDRHQRRIDLVDTL